MAESKHRRKIGNYLLNKSLQLRYVALVSALSAVIAGSLGFLISRQEKDASAYVMAAASSSDLPDDVKADIKSSVEGHDSRLARDMVLVGVCLVVVLSLYLVVMTHKVAGPLYKVSLYFDKMAEGKLGEVWPLRKGDMLTDFYDKFSAAHRAVRKRHQDDNEAVGRFLAACEPAGLPSQGALGHQLDELKAHHRQRSEALK